MAGVMTTPSQTGYGGNQVTTRVGEQQDANKEYVNIDVGHWHEMVDPCEMLERELTIQDQVDNEMDGLEFVHPAEIVMQNSYPKQWGQEFLSPTNGTLNYWQIY